MKNFSDRGYRPPSGIHELLCLLNDFIFNIRAIPIMLWKQNHRSQFSMCRTTILDNYPASYLKKRRYL